MEEQAANTSQQKGRTRQAETRWYEGQNREIVIYYLIAVFFLEIIVGTAAFFYGVAHPVVQTAGGPKLANFPWVGWVISAILAPVALLLLFHLSGWFFTRSLNEEKKEKADGDETAIPRNVQLIYSMLSNAPVIVVLLGLIALGAALYFLDTALGTLRPYIPWILGSATTFLVICYIARLVFLAKHNRMEQEYAYRMRVFEKSGIVITDAGSIPITAEDIAATRKALASIQAALPEAKEAEKESDSDIEDATVVEETNNVEGKDKKGENSAF